MPNQRLSDYAAAKPGRARPQAQVRFLMHQKKSLIDQADGSKNPGIHHHAAAVDNIDLRDGSRFAGVKRYRFSLDQTIVVGPVKGEAVRTNLVRLIHERDDPTENAVLWHLTGSLEQQVEQVR